MNKNKIKTIKDLIGLYIRTDDGIFKIESLETTHLYTVISGLYNNDRYYFSINGGFYSVLKEFEISDKIIELLRYGDLIRYRDISYFYPIVEFNDDGSFLYGTGKDKLLCGKVESEQDLLEINSIAIVNDGSDRIFIQSPRLIYETKI